MLDLHNAIMNIQATPGMLADEYVSAYKMGHKDARHAAAELAATHAGAAAEPVAWTLQWPSDSRINVGTVFDTEIEAKEYADKCDSVVVVPLYSALAALAALTSAPAEPVVRDPECEYIDELIFKLECFIDHATGGKLSKSSWALETLKAAHDEHVKAREDAAVAEVAETPPAAGAAQAVADAAGEAFNNTFHKCRAEVSMDWWQRIWAVAARWAWEHPQSDAVPTLRSALNAMLTQFGMDEDDWNKPTFDQARRALAATPAPEASKPTLDQKINARGLLEELLDKTYQNGYDDAIKAAQPAERPGGIGVAGDWEARDSFKSPDQVKTTHFASSDPEGHRQAIADYEGDK